MRWRFSDEKNRNAPRRYLGIVDLIKTYDETNELRFIIVTAGLCLN